MTKKKQPKVQKPFEVLPAVRQEPDGKWYAACTLIVNGKIEEQALYTQVGFKNVRRAKQLARTAAAIMETDIKRRILKQVIEMGEGLLK